MTASSTGRDVEIVSQKSPQVDKASPSRSLLRRVPRSRLAAIVAGTALIVGHAALYGHWLIDDAGITFAYARSIAEGHGPVLQAGATPVEGYSNPAWLALLVAGRVLGLFDRGTIFGIPDYVLFPKALGALSCAGILAAFYAAARATNQTLARHRSPAVTVGEHLRPPSGAGRWSFRMNTADGRALLVMLAGAALLAANPSFVIWSFSGLENSLYALAVVLLAVVMYCAVLSGQLLGVKTATASGLLAAVAALTRPDGVIYVAAFPLVATCLVGRGRWLRTGVALVVDAAAFAFPFGLYELWRYATFGRLVSNTAVAKAQQPPTWADLLRAHELASYVGWPAVAVGAASVAAVLVGSRRLRAGFVALLVPLTLAVVAYCILRADWMGEFRFATPVWAVATLVGSLAVAQVLAWSRPRWRIAVAVIVGAALFAQAGSLYSGMKTFRDNPTVALCKVADIDGRTVNGYADLLGVTHGTYLGADLGGTSLTSRLTIVDMAGLANRRVADFRQRGDFSGLRDYILESIRPTFMNIHGAFNDGLTSDQRLARDYYFVYGDDWVRKDVVASPAILAQLRAYAKASYKRVLFLEHYAPRRDCGPVLRPGQAFKP